MSKNKHILILYSVLALALLAIGYELLQPTGETNVKKDKSSLSDNRTFFWEIYPELVIPNAGKIIDKELKLRDQHDAEISIQEILKKAPLLVFRYSRYDCDLCIDQVLGKLKPVFKGYEQKVCLIIDGMTEREFRMKYKDREISFSAYFVAKDNLGLSLENKNLPFLFVLTEEVKANQIFIPFREHPGQTDTYLKNIKAQLRD